MNHEKAEGCIARLPFFMSPGDRFRTAAHSTACLRNRERQTEKERQGGRLFLQIGLTRF